MCYSCWLTPHVGFQLCFWEWFIGPAEKSRAKPLHWDLLTLGSNAGGSPFQHGMDFFPFLADKWSAYVRWDIEEKMESLKPLEGSMWNSVVGLCQHRVNLLQFWYLREPRRRRGRSSQGHCSAKPPRSRQGLQLETFSITGSTRGCFDTNLISTITQ